MLPGTTENPKEASPTHAASKKMLLFVCGQSVRNESPGVPLGACVLGRKPLLFA